MFSGDIQQIKILVRLCLQPTRHASLTFAKNFVCFAYKCGTLSETRVAAAAAAAAGTRLPVHLSTFMLAALSIPLQLPFKTMPKRWARLNFKYIVFFFWFFFVLSLQLKFMRGPWLNMLSYS